MAARRDALTGRPTTSAETPNPFERVSSVRRRIDSAGCGGPVGMAARWDGLAGQPTSSAERPTRFNGFRLLAAELMRRAGAWGRGWRRGGKCWRRDDPQAAPNAQPVSTGFGCQPPNQFGGLGRADGDGGAVGGVDGTTHEQRRMPNPFQRVSAVRRRIDSAGCGVRTGMAARWETLTGRPTSRAEGPTRFNGFRLSAAELIRRAAAWGWGWRRGWRRGWRS